MRSLLHAVPQNNTAATSTNTTRSSTRLTEPHQKCHLQGTCLPELHPHRREIFLLYFSSPRKHKVTQQRAHPAGLSSGPAAPAARPPGAAGLTPEHSAAGTCLDALPAPLPNTAGLSPAPFPSDTCTSLIQLPFISICQITIFTCAKRHNSND